MAELSGLTQVADPEVLARWRSGPRWYHVVVALIEDDEVEARRRAVADLLGPDLVAISAPGQPHVTIWAAGFEPAGRLPDSGTIPVTVGGATTFTSAAYLTVTGPGLARVRSRLTADGLAEDRESPYVPHVTVGTYQRAIPLTEVADRLGSLADAAPIPVIAPIRHLVVDTRSQVGALSPP